VTIGIASNPGAATLAGSASAAAVAGVAKFNDLSLNRAENGYSLSATSPGLSTARSATFDENDTADQCLQNITCQTQLVNPASQVGVTATPDTAQINTGTISESLDVGVPLNCSGYAQEDPHSYEFFMSSVNRSKTLNYIIKQPAIPLIGTVNAILALTQVCFYAPYQFTTSAGTPATPVTFPDGSGFIGLLPTCPASGPCIASKSSQLDLNNMLGFDIVLTVNVPEGLAQDPRMRA
jgi:hypothetical protein